MQNLINAMRALGDIKNGIAPERLVIPGLTHLLD
jgi:hypothetical protein